MALSNPYSQLWPEPEPGDQLPPKQPDLEPGDHVILYLAGVPVKGRIRSFTSRFGIALVIPDQSPKWRAIPAYPHELTLLEKAASAQV
ncbi:MAG: hypothetical protein K8L99_15105 [Anaerolineae bacterium]|nr:hypothetical protein [Anaerolineae bacterium]